MSKDFKQYDSKWATHSYCKTTMKAAGCGPTAVADIFYNFDKTITPPKVADWLTRNGWDSYRQGTVWGGIPAYFNKNGAKATQLNANNFYGKKNTSAEKNWIAKMKSGKYWGILLMGKSMWTKGGHYIAVTEYRDGKYYVMDPAGRNDGWHTWSAFSGVVKVFYLVDHPAKAAETTTVKPATTATTKLDVDGSWGVKTTKLAQKVFKVTQDGRVNKQPKSNAQWLTACASEAWEFTSNNNGGDPLIVEFQKKFGLTRDGWFGPKTIKAFQKWLSVEKTGECDANTVKAFQKWLNSKA